MEEGEGGTGIEDGGRWVGGGEVVREGLRGKVGERKG